MPKAILEFDLPDERYEFNLATHAPRLYNALHTIDQELRQIYKYEADIFNGQKFKDIDELIDLIRAYIGQETNPVEAD